MNTSTAPRIISVDRTSRGIIVTFEDGKCALYAASFLYSKLPYAETVYNDEVEDDEDRSDTL
jgi:hypothetical protein